MSDRNFGMGMFGLSTGSLNPLHSIKTPCPLDCKVFTYPFNDILEHLRSGSTTKVTSIYKSWFGISSSLLHFPISLAIESPTLHPNFLLGQRNCHQSRSVVQSIISHPQKLRTQFLRWPQIIYCSNFEPYLLSYESSNKVIRGAGIN